MLDSKQAEAAMRGGAGRGATAGIGAGAGRGACATGLGGGGAGGAAAVQPMRLAPASIAPVTRCATTRRSEVWAGERSVSLMMPCPQSTDGR